MKLRRIELIGFKSFLNKTTLSFDDGITAIVGPNGCGKSNIVDALFWVMGDQSAKHLRGVDMEDVIFSGTDKESHSGLAEVHVTFSTEDGGVPQEYSEFEEVTVSRRLYRSGESEYLINKTPCRMKDVAEFFMDTGAGAKSYSIIEQGQIGRIISQKPEERRGLIEEAAGVIKFKSRKREAILKIEATEQNLLRLNDVILELKRQIDFLERQAKKAQKYKKLKEDIRDKELTIMSLEYKTSFEKLKEIEGALKNQKDQKQEFLTETQKVEALIEKLKVNLITLEQDLNLNQATLYETQQKIQELENDIVLKKKEIENWKTLEVKDYESKEAILEKKTKLQKNNDHLLKAIEECGQEETLKHKGLEEKDTVLQSEIQKQNVLSQKIEANKGERLLLLTEKASCERTLSHLAEEKKDLDNQWEELFEEEENLKHTCGAVRQQKSKYEASLLDITSQKEVLSTQKLEHEKELKYSKVLLSQNLAQRDNIKEKWQHVISRLCSLREIEKNFEECENVPASLSILADVIEVDHQYEKALEAVLEYRLQYVLVQDRATLLEILRVSASPVFAHFILMERPSFSLDSSMPHEWVALEPLWKKIKVQSQHENLLKYLLKETYVAANLEEAFKYWDQHPYQYTFVTSQGEMIDKEGVVRIGQSRVGEQKGILSRRREIKELEQKELVLQKEHKTLASEIEKLEVVLQDLEKKLETLEKELHEKDVLETSFVKDVSKSEEDVERLEEEKEELSNKKNHLSKCREECVQAIAKEERQHRLLEDKKKVNESSLETDTRTEKRVLGDLENQKTLIQAIHVELAALREKKEALLRQEEHHEGNIKTFDQEIEEKEKALDLAKQKQEEITLEIQKNTTVLSDLIKELEKIRNGLSTLKNSFDQENCRLKVLEEGVKKHRSLFSTLESQVHEKELLFSQYQMTIDHLRVQCEEKYRVRLEDIFERYLEKTITEEDKQDLIKLKEKAANVADVNLGAIEEFEELKGRYQSLITQKEDLLASLEDLKKMIEKINRVTRQKFEETFEVVNTNFKKVFPVLFEGGRAELTLTEPNNLLETGVDIMAKPPGKKLQNINLLSGGEKALTATSLIFAIFLMKRSPFCILDEVDAPLDDANVGRFIEMVSTLTSQSQFIVITHNKKTMSMADVLYGVTMEQPGISNMISVKLEKAIQITESQRQKELSHQISV